jgi:hypothetical protein
MPCVFGTAGTAPKMHNLARCGSFWGDGMVGKIRSVATAGTARRSSAVATVGVLVGGLARLERSRV